MLAGAMLIAISGLTLWSYGAPTNLRFVTLVGNDSASSLDRAANSPTITVDPTDSKTILISERIDRPRFSCALYRSSDAGAHWTQIAIPIPPRYDTCYAPDITFDRNGNSILVFLTLNTHPKDPLSAGNDPNGVWLTRSNDGGKTFGPPREVLGPDRIQVRIASDPASDRLYLLWLNGSDLENHTPLGLGPAPNPLKISVSNDGGTTFSAPVQVNSSRHLRVGAASLVTGADGSVRVLFEDFADDLNDYNNRALPFNGRFSLILASSHDHGRTFAESIIDDRVVRASPFLAYLPPQPALSIDPAGRNVFVAWQDGRAGAPDILFRRSSDGGRTWHGLQRLNERDSEPSAAFLPALSSSTDGRLDAGFLNAKNDGSRLATNAMYARSNDGGTTFSKPVAVTEVPFDGFAGPENPRTQTVDLGSRLALRSTMDRAFFAWPDSHLGTADSGRQDVFFASVDASARLEPPAATALGPERAPVKRDALGNLDPARACAKLKPARVVFLAYESVPDELDGLRFFVADWGKAKGCFQGRVITDSRQLRTFDYDVAIVDVSRDSAIPATAIADIAQIIRDGKRVAFFMQPADFSTKLDAPGRFEALRALFPGLKMNRTCANSQFTGITGGPFDLSQRSFHYESFVHGVYNVEVSGASEPWAIDLCKTGKPTMIRSANGVIAGFYLAYEVSLADNNAPAITAKRLVVNVIHELARR